LFLKVPPSGRQLGWNEIQVGGSQVGLVGLVPDSSPFTSLAAIRLKANLGQVRALIRHFLGITGKIWQTRHGTVDVKLS
jgi:hypothetical protein